MAGSLNHMVSPDGTFRFDLIENMRDAREACEECFYLIAELSGGDAERLNAACDKLNFPRPKAVPVLAEEERLARRLAARALGTHLGDPEGRRLPDDLWKQKLPEARKKLERILERKETGPGENND